MANQTAIRTATEADADRLLHVFNLAFSADPLLRWVAPSLESCMKAMPQLFWSFGGRAALDAGTFRVMEDFSGWCDWLPPGWHIDEVGLGQMFEDCSPPELMPDIDSVFSRMAAYHPEEPHWYLPLIMVDPWHQGKGVGGKLLEDGMASCDERHLVSYLEATTPSSARLYERYGYKVLDEISAGSSPPVFPMRREAR